MVVWICQVHSISQGKGGPVNHVKVGCPMTYLSPKGTNKSLLISSPPIIIYLPRGTFGPISPFLFLILPTLSIIYSSTMVHDPTPHIDYSLALPCQLPFLIFNLLPSPSWICFNLINHSLIFFICIYIYNILFYNGGLFCFLHTHGN